MAARKYPESVLTKSKSGRTEVRMLLAKGRFVKYAYADVETGELERKFKVVLVPEKGEEEAFYIIPLQKWRSLAIPDNERNRGKRVWDGKKAIKI